MTTAYNLTLYIAEKWGEDALPKLMRELSEPTAFTINQSCKKNSRDIC